MGGCPRSGLLGKYLPTLVIGSKREFDPLQTDHRPTLKVTNGRPRRTNRQ